MHRFSLFLVAALSVVASWAQMRDYTLNIGDFYELTVADNIPVVYKANTDSAGYAMYSCTPEIASSIAFSNDKSKLKVQYNQDSEIGKMPTIVLYSTTLTKVTNWGDSTVCIERMSPAIEFKAKVIGNGDISIPSLVCTKLDAAVQAGSGHIFVAGKAKIERLTLISAGSIEAGSVEAEDVTCQIGGIGSIDCYATQKLNVKILGSGKVYYRGNPESVKKHGIGGKLIKIED